MFFKLGITNFSSWNPYILLLKIISSMVFDSRCQSFTAQWCISPISSLREALLNARRDTVTHHASIKYLPEKCQLNFFWLFKKIVLNIILEDFAAWTRRANNYFCSAWQSNDLNGLASSIKQYISFVKYFIFY